MGRWSWDRLAALSGIVFVGLFIASFFAAPKPPDLNDSRLQWVNYFLDHHRAVKISGILGGLAVIAFVWFLGSLGTAIRASGEQRVAAIAFGGGLVTAGLALVTIAQARNTISVMSP